MARTFVRILLATIVAVALCGITACDQSAPTEQADMDMEMGMEEPAEMAEEGAMAVEEAEPEEEDTE